MRGMNNVAPTVPPPPEVFEVESARISCDGGNGALGHPRVWLTINKDGYVDCGYCDRRYVLKAGAGHHGH
jgi:uncharacterized Zn-finger protein